MFDGRDRLNVLVGHEVSSSMEESIENVSVNFPTTMGFEDMKANIGGRHGIAEPVYYLCRREHAFILRACQLHDDGQVFAYGNGTCRWFQ